MVSDPGDIEEVEKRVRQIQREKRGRVRWTASRHTAELALDALVPAERPKRPSSKGRRRKRRKRLL